MVYNIFRTEVILVSFPTASPLGEHRFTFVVMADTHVNQSEESSASPYPSTLLTNPRTRWVIHAINQLAPDFVVHMGDLTNPVPSLPTYLQAVDRFRQLIEPLQCPIYFVPGNHDIGDKPVAWMPAKTVNESYLDQYETHFGRSYYSFAHKACRFVITNSPVINSGLPHETQQRTWLEVDLAAHTGERTFFFTHYPIFIAKPDEASHYDNIDEPGRSWFLGLLEQANVEALFTAHVHNFFYNRHASTDCYTVPAVAFVRHDYAEFFRADPAPEFARNDGSKLGFYVVKVYDTGHTVHFVRSNGAFLATDKQPPATSSRRFAPHPRQRRAMPLGIHLRHPWAEMTAIPATGGADEFARKLARNDYPLLSLWEMGVRKLRVPLQDLVDDHARARMTLMQQMGYEFTVYSFGLPAGNQRAVLLHHSDLIATYEFILDWKNLDTTLDEIRQLQQEASFPVLLSRLRGKEDETGSGAKGFYFHNIRHGFRHDDPELADPRLNQAVADGLLHGLAFHLPRTEFPWPALLTIAATAQRLGLRAVAELRMVSDNPAEPFVDDLANANRVAEALVAARTLENVDIYVDSLIDVDRGYFARTGLYDRRYAPRLGGQVVQHLTALLSALLDETASVLAPLAAESEDAARLLMLRCGDIRLIVVLPQPEFALDTLPAVLNLSGAQGTCRVTRLDSGAETSVAWKRTDSGFDASAPIHCSVPTLIMLHNP